MPKNPALSHLDLELEWLRALLIVRIREMQAIGLLTGAEDLRPGVTVYAQEIEARLNERKHEAYDPTLEEIQAKEALAILSQRRDRFYAGRENFDIHTPLAFLKQQYHLSDAQYLLLLLTVAPAFNPSFSRLYAFIQNNFDRQYPTLGLFIEVFSRDHDCAYLAELIAPGSVLIAEGLIELRYTSPHLPLNVQALALPQRIQSFIAGTNPIDSSIASFSEFRARENILGRTILTPKQSIEWQTKLDKLKHLATPAWQMPL